VLEGSTNGGRFIAPAVRRSMPLPPGAGTRYLDPHGDLTRERWASTKVALDAVPLTPAQHDKIVDAAQRTFDAITLLMDELPKAS
jgi:heme oxygenase